MAVSSYSICMYLRRVFRPGAGTHSTRVDFLFCYQFSYVFYVCFICFSSTAFRCFSYRAVQLSRCFSSRQCSYFAASRVGCVVSCGGRLGPPCALARGGMGQQAFWGQVSSATSPCELRTIFFSDVVRHSVRPPHPLLLSGRGSQGLRYTSCSFLGGGFLSTHQATDEFVSSRSPQ